MKTDRLLNDSRHRLLNESRHMIYHLALVSLSASIALSMPALVRTFADRFHDYWAKIESDSFTLIVTEIAIALCLLSLFNVAGRSLQNRRLARVAAGAGLVHFFPCQHMIGKRRSRRLKEGCGHGSTVLMIGSTGYRTFADQEGDLHEVLKHCLEAKLLLLDPESEGARIRARALQLPIDGFREQIAASIAFLKTLKAAQINVKLKLYSEEPHVKLTILGDHMWIQHYHPGMDVHLLPEYVCRQNASNQAFFTLFYEYFLRRWEDPDTPEYDFETDELVYPGSLEERKRLRLRDTRTRCARFAQAGFHPPREGAEPGIESRLSARVMSY